jgi:hypothetical protein
LSHRFDRSPRKSPSSCALALSQASSSNWPILLSQMTDATQSQAKIPQKKCDSHQPIATAHFQIDPLAPHLPPKTRAAFVPTTSDWFQAPRMTPKIKNSKILTHSSQQSLPRLAPLSRFPRAIASTDRLQICQFTRLHHRHNVRHASDRFYAVRPQTQSLH